MIPEAVDKAFDKAFDKAVDKAVDRINGSRDQINDKLDSVERHVNHI